MAPVIIRGRPNKRAPYVITVIERSIPNTNKKPIKRSGGDFTPEKWRSIRYLCLIFFGRISAIYRYILFGPLFLLNFLTQRSLGAKPRLRRNAFAFLVSLWDFRAGIVCIFLPFYSVTKQIWPFCLDDSHEHQLKKDNNPQ